MLACALPCSFPHSWRTGTSFDSFGRCPSWPWVPIWRHTSFQGPFLKAMWINLFQVCLHSPCFALHCVSTGPSCSWVLMHPHATPQGISTCSHFQALQAALLCGASFLQLWAEPTQIHRAIYCEHGQHSSPGHGAREGSLNPFSYLDMKTWRHASAAFGREGAVSSSRKSISLSIDEVFCSFFNCDLELGGSRAGYCELVRSFPFPFSHTSIYSQPSQLDQPKNDQRKKEEV